MATSNIVFQELCEICKKSGFHRRGHTFFRVQGDGVLLVLQYERKLRPFYSERLLFGFFSMYNELLPQWFTSHGAIPQYDTRYLTKSRAERTPSPLPTVIDMTAGDSLEDWIEFHLDLSEFGDMILPYLSSIQTQHQLCEAICYADIQESGSIRWNDSLKAAPYAAVGDWDSAAKVIRAILCQHDVIWDSDEELIACRNLLRDEDQELVDRLALFVSRDTDRIHAYLQNNYEANRKYASFYMPKEHHPMIYDFIKQKYQFALEQMRPYLDDLESAFDTMSNSVVRYQYAKGGTNNHRGYYCPSPIRDIVIGNCHRGHLYKTQPRTRQPSFIYGFNAQEELVTTESESCGKEFILYINHATIGISYTISEEYGLWLGTITLCEYNEAGQILLYLLCSDPSDDPLLMHQYELELYHYGEQGLEYVDWYYILRSNPLYISHNIFTFQHNADGELSGYTIETRHGIDDVPQKRAFPDHVYEVYIKRRV